MKKWCNNILLFFSCLLALSCSETDRAKAIKSEGKFLDHKSHTLKLNVTWIQEVKLEEGKARELEIATIAAEINEKKLNPEDIALVSDEFFTYREGKIIITSEKYQKLFDYLIENTKYASKSLAIEFRYAGGNEHYLKHDKRVKTSLVGYAIPKEEEESESHYQVQYQNWKTQYEVLKAKPSFLGAIKILKNQKEISQYIGVKVSSPQGVKFNKNTRQFFIPFDKKFTIFKKVQEASGHKMTQKIVFSYGGKTFTKEVELFTAAPRKPAPESEDEVAVATIEFTNVANSPTVKEGDTDLIDVAQVSITRTDGKEVDEKKVTLSSDALSFSQNKVQLDPKKITKSGTLTLTLTYEGVTATRTLSITYQEKKRAIVGTLENSFEVNKSGNKNIALGAVSLEVEGVKDSSAVIISNVGEVIKGQLTLKGTDLDQVYAELLKEESNGFKKTYELTLTSGLITKKHSYTLFAQPEVKVSLNPHKEIKAHESAQKVFLGKIEKTIDGKSTKLLKDQWTLNSVSIDSKDVKDVIALEDNLLVVEKEKVAEVIGKELFLKYTTLGVNKEKKIKVKTLHTMPTLKKIEGSSETIINVQNPLVFNLKGVSAPFPMIKVQDKELKFSTSKFIAFVDSTITLTEDGLSEAQSKEKLILTYRYHNSAYEQEINFVDSDQDFLIILKDSYALERYEELEKDYVLGEVQGIKIHNGSAISIRLNPYDYFSLVNKKLQIKKDKYQDFLTSFGGDSSQDFELVFKHNSQEVTKKITLTLQENYQKCLSLQNTCSQMYFVPATDNETLKKLCGLSIPAKDKCSSLKVSLESMELKDILGKQSELSLTHKIQDKKVDIGLSYNDFYDELGIAINDLFYTLNIKLQDDYGSLTQKISGTMSFTRTKQNPLDSYSIALEKGTFSVLDTKIKENFVLGELTSKEESGLLLKNHRDIFTYVPSSKRLLITPAGFEKLLENKKEKYSLIFVNKKKVEQKLDIEFEVIQKSSCSLVFKDSGGFKDLKNFKGTNTKVNPETKSGDELTFFEIPLFKYQCLVEDFFQSYLEVSFDAVKVDQNMEGFLKIDELKDDAWKLAIKDVGKLTAYLDNKGKIESIPLVFSNSEVKQTVDLQMTIERDSFLEKLKTQENLGELFTFVENGSFSYPDKAGYLAKEEQKSLSEPKSEDYLRKSSTSLLTTDVNLKDHEFFIAANDDLFKGEKIYTADLDKKNITISPLESLVFQNKKVKVQDYKSFLKAIKDYKNDKTYAFTLLIKKKGATAFSFFHKVEFRVEEYQNMSPVTVTDNKASDFINGDKKPFIAHISEKDGAVFCSGVFLNRSTVITAKSCFSRFVTENFVSAVKRNDENLNSVITNNLKEKRDGLTFTLTKEGMSGESTKHEFSWEVINFYEKDYVLIDLSGDDSLALNSASLLTTNEDDDSDVNLNYNHEKPLYYLGGQGDTHLDIDHSVSVQECLALEEETYRPFVELRRVETSYSHMRNDAYAPHSKFLDFIHYGYEKSLVETTCAHSALSKGGLYVQYNGSSGFFPVGIATGTLYDESVAHSEQLSEGADLETYKEATYGLRVPKGIYREGLGNLSPGAMSLIDVEELDAELKVIEQKSEQA